jgi:hypothetical protein
MDNSEVDFKELVKCRMKYKRDLRKYLRKLSIQFFRKFEYENLKQCGKAGCKDCIDHVYIDDKDLYFLIYENNEGHFMNYYFLVDELNALIKLHR